MTPADYYGVFSYLKTELLLSEYFLSSQVDRDVCIAINQSMVFGIGECV